ncbi:hypothetical protein ACF0H5_024396 [Mactra antiquata]
MNADQHDIADSDIEMDGINKTGIKETNEINENLEDSLENEYQDSVVAGRGEIDSVSEIRMNPTSVKESSEDSLGSNIQHGIAAGSREIDCIAKTEVMEIPVSMVNEALEDSLGSDSVDNGRTVQPRIVMFDDSASNDSNPFMISCFYSLASSPELDQVDDEDKGIADEIEKGLDEDQSNAKKESTKFCEDGHDISENSKFSRVGHENSETTKFSEVGCDISETTKFSELGHNISETTKFSEVGHDISGNSKFSEVGHENSKNTKSTKLDQKHLLHTDNKTNGISQTFQNNFVVSMATVDKHVISNDYVENTSRSEFESQNILPIKHLEEGNRSDKEIIDNGSKNIHNDFEVQLIDMKEEIQHEKVNDKKMAEGIGSDLEKIENNSSNVNEHLEVNSVDMNEENRDKLEADVKGVKRNGLDINVEESSILQQNLSTEGPHYMQENLDTSSEFNALSNDSDQFDKDTKCRTNKNNRHLGTKKSRKQNIPKRILRDSKEYSVSMDTDSESNLSEELDDKVDEKSADTENEKGPTCNDIYIDIDDVETASNGSHIDNHDDDEIEDKSLEGRSNIKRNVVNVTENMAESADKECHINESAELMIPSPSQLNSLYFGLAPDLNAYPSMVDAHGLKLNSTTTFVLDENGPENLEVIRQLREIRCNRYRKISMLEKREIAGYASAHGVSQAAAFYNVSKSAVSMWTKLDFSQVDENSPRNKRNCMIGNEKFESLCRRVQADKEWKFKNVSKHDKFEVSRYAKLVGVREMARCLDVALGTVSGWMRQFPYKIESKLTPNEHNMDDAPSDSKDSAKNTSTDFDKASANKLHKTENNGRLGKGKSGRTHKRKIGCNVGSVDGLKEKYETVQDGNSMYVLPATDVEVSDIESGDEASPMKQMKLDRSVMNENNNSSDSFETNDEVDQMIAETLQKKDTTICFDDVKDMIQNTPLVDDDFFRSLFKRVIACKADKYKTLKPSEKLEVVRYSKRVGVRRIAKILGLATGTLSGWTTKYQSNLSLTDSTIDNPEKPDLLVSYLAPNSENQSIGSTSSSASGNHLDNTEKSEVTAVKLLFKENYEIMVRKIEVAKQIKFRNINKDEKIEFVKCSKLVGIRPTARVFGIPIGTLSGWITKYSKTLHPAYHIEGDVSLNGSVAESVMNSDQSGNSVPLVVGRNPDPKSPFTGLQSGLKSDTTNGWPYVPSLTSLPSNSEFNKFSYLNQTGLQNSKFDYQYGGLNANRMTGFVHEENVDSKNDVNQYRNELKGNQSKSVNHSNLEIGTSPQMLENKNQLKSSAVVTGNDDNDDDDAKLRAQKYLNTVYQRLGLKRVDTAL